MSYVPKIYLADGGDRLHTDSEAIIESVSADGEMAIPIVIRKSFDGTSSPVSIYDSDAPTDMRIVDAHVIITSTGSSATTVKLTDGTNDITDAIDVYDGGGVSDTDIISASQIDDAYYEISEDGSLELALSDTTDSPAGIVVVTALVV